MKLPMNIRKMPVSEFCEKFGADLNAVVNAEEIKLKNQVVGGSAPLTSTKRGRTTPRSKAVVDPSEGFNMATMQALQGKGLEEQLRFLQQWQNQLDAFASQLKVAK